MAATIHDRVGRSRSRGARAPRFRVWLVRGRDGALHVTMLRRHIVGGEAAGYVAKTITPGIPVFGNRVVLDVYVSSTSASATITVDGSYDGKVWRSTAAQISASAVGPYSVALSGVDFAYVRIRAFLLNVNRRMVFDAGLTFSAQ